MDFGASLPANLGLKAIPLGSQVEAGGKLWYLHVALVTQLRWGVSVSMGPTSLGLWGAFACFVPFVVLARCTFLGAGHCAFLAEPHATAYLGAWAIF